MLRAFSAGGAYFSGVFAAGTLLGVARVLVLEPAIGAVPAVLIELPIILFIAWVICRWLVRHFLVGRAFGARLVRGGVAFFFLIGAETLIGLVGFGRSLSAQVQAYRDVAPALGLAGQILFAVVPLLVERRGA